MTLTGSGMLLTLRHYIGFLSNAVDFLRYVALNVVNLRCLVVIHWSFQILKSLFTTPQMHLENIHNATMVNAPERALHLKTREN